MMTTYFKPVIMNKEEQKQARINKILDDAAALLEKEGVKYMLGVVDRNPRATDGGKAYCNMDLKGPDFIYILDIAMPTNQDITNLGIYVGQLITARLKNKKPQTLIP